MWKDAKGAPANMLPGQRGHDGQPRYAIPRVPGAPPPPGAAAAAAVAAAREAADLEKARLSSLQDEQRRQQQAATYLRPCVGFQDPSDRQTEVQTRGHPFGWRAKEARFRGYSSPAGASPFTPPASLP